MEVNDKLKALRQLMESEGIDTYIITKFDPHQSEYSPDYWNGVMFISGFTGSAGTVVITKDKACLWVDGRYDVQAVNQTKGTEFQVLKTSDPKTKDYLEFAKDETKKEGKIGFDGRTLSFEVGRKLQKLVKHKQIKLETELDLCGKIWTDRPQTSVAPVYNFLEKYCGKSRTDKIKAVREKMDQDGVNVYVISSLDDIAWLFNLRGNDSLHCTFFAAFAVIDEESATLFIHGEKAKDVKELLENDGISVKEYEDVKAYLEQYSNCDRYINIALNPLTTSFSLSLAITGLNYMETTPDYTTSLKAVKNDVELLNLEKANVIDGVAMVRFIKWVKENAGTGELTEYNVDDALLKFRQMGENFVMPSFSTIAAYMGNAAMMHYSATEVKHDKIMPKGMLLVDSGGQYLYGTTDITRTIVLGEITPEMKKDFTLVLISHINLATAKFLYGASGTNLDILSRYPMWQNGLDYKCGTGHGLGFFLNVHEGPHSIRMQSNSIKLEIGMIMTNEPGIYRENQYGIRTENTVKVVPHSTTEFGEFLCFETFSYCPIDLNGIEKDMLTTDQLDWLNKYHKTVYEKLSPYLSEDEKVWLKDATKPL